MELSLPKTDIEITFPRDPSLLQSDHRNFLRESNYFMAEYHFHKHMPRHFEPFAGAKYGYLKRSDKYNKRKLRIVGHKIDNVFSGASRREITTKRQIVATPKGAKLKMRLPVEGVTGRLMDEDAARRIARAKGKTFNGFTQRQVSARINILKRAAEMEVVAKDETNTLIRVRADEYTRLANQPGIQKRVRVRIIK
ncbi:MAG: hypothetical protein V4719_26630 [Planctomycetota bacterium]